MRLVIEVDDPEIVVQLRFAGKAAASAGTMPNDEDTEQTEAKDAGSAPSAPVMGPLMNVSQTSETARPENGKRLPAAGEPLATSGQPNASSAQASGQVPMIDAGAPPADLLNNAASARAGTGD